MKWLPFLLLVGCTSEPFEFRANVGWDQSKATDVLTVKVDGVRVDSGGQHTFFESFPSYGVALMEYVPKEVVITTSGGTRREVIDLGACRNEGGELEAIVLEEIWFGFVTIDGISHFGMGRGNCVDVDGQGVSWDY